MADLIPIYCDEIVPGDSFKVKSEIFIRFAPMLAPIMHRINVYTHYFFVPHRLVWDNFQQFITGGVDGTDATPHPRVSFSEGQRNLIDKGSLADYLGVPSPKTGVTINGQIDVNALPFRAYQLIWNEYYMDQTLSTPISFQKADTVDPAERLAITKLQKRAWEKDYFTSCLPWAQRGSEVLLPMQNEITYKEGQTLPEGTTTAGNLTVTSSGSILRPAGAAVIENIESIESQLTINELRKSIKLQEWLEKNARGGSRYVEMILSHFGIKSSDARLQRPEYLGGGKQPIQVSEVLSTFNNETVPGGEMYGHGISVGTTNTFKKTFEEHGYIFGIMSIIPRSSYTGGLPRLLQKATRFDYYWPEFAQIGEQPVFNTEIYFDWENTHGKRYDNFGYQSRYSEYKFNNSTVHGDFKDNLDYWHLGRSFTEPPALNEEFVTCNPDQRIFAVTDPAVHKLYIQLYNDVKAIRPMPVFGSPTL